MQVTLIITSSPLCLREIISLAVMYKNWWAPRSAWMIRRKEKPLSPTGVRNPDYPVRRIVTTSTELSGLYHWIGEEINLETIIRKKKKKAKSLFIYLFIYCLFFKEESARFSQCNDWVTDWTPEKLWFEPREGQEISVLYETFISLSLFLHSSSKYPPRLLFSCTVNKLPYHKNPILHSQFLEVSDLTYVCM